SIDREALNQVVWDGLYTPGCTPIPPISVFFDKTRKCPGRDVARAKKLLAEAGLAGGYAFEMTIINNPAERRVGEVIQQMARAAQHHIPLSPQLHREELQGIQRRARRSHPGQGNILELIG